MEFEIVIVAIKIISAAAAAALGIVGSIFNHRGHDGQLTRSGRAIVIGFICSSAVSALGSVVETIKSLEDSSKQARISQETLYEFSRAVQPITKLEISFIMDLSESS